MCCVSGNDNNFSLRLLVGLAQSTMVGRFHIVLLDSGFCLKPGLVSQFDSLCIVACISCCLGLPGELFRVSPDPVVSLGGLDGIFGVCDGRRGVSTCLGPPAG